MTSLSDRKEIAARLRSKFVCGLGITPGSIAYVLGYTAPKGATYDDAVRELFELLADLVNPTCELKIQNGHACCGNCGHILAGEYEAEEDYWCFRPYCPHCGARVVSEDA